MSDELQPPILLKPIPKQRVTVGTFYRLDLTEYVENSVTEEENFGDDVSIDLLYSLETADGNDFPVGLDYTPVGEIYGQLRSPALQYSPYTIKVIVTNGALKALETSFELEVLPALSPEEEWKVEEELLDEFADDVALSEEERQELYDTLGNEEVKKEAKFTEDKQEIWQAILQGQAIPEIEALLNRPITHEEIYYLLSRMAYFVIWDANNPDPAGPMYPLSLKNASEHFHVYDRGACIVATPKHLFDHGRTLLHAVKTAQAIAEEVFKRGWGVELAGLDKLVRAAWITFELLSQTHARTVKYSYFSPTPHDIEVFNQAKNIQLK